MTHRQHHFLRGARAYLSGPMDFVADRATEKASGWRVRLRQYLENLGVTVFDPWDKPRARGLHEYGLEDVTTLHRRDTWSFEASDNGSTRRAELAEFFWETQHIDLRMVDISDFVIAYCPTNIYSVGTVHEIVTARNQHKPVLFVSPPVTFPTLRKLESLAANNPELTKLLSELRQELPIKENPRGIPSLWYMPLIGSESFFDGFGFYQDRFHDCFPAWRDPSALDHREISEPPQRPLLLFLEQLSRGNKVPQHWDHVAKRYVADDDWLLLEKALDV